MNRARKTGGICRLLLGCLLLAPTAVPAASPERGGAVAQPGRLTPEQMAQLQQERNSAVARKSPGGQPSKGPESFASQALQKFTAQLQRDNARFTAQQDQGPSDVRALMPTKDACTSPTITVISASPPLIPGEIVELNGCGFGIKQPGDELRLLGTLGNFAPTQYIKMHIMTWKGWFIRARVPEGTKGYMNDSNAKLQVVLNSGKISNLASPAAGFEATPVAMKLKPSEVSFSCYGKGFPKAFNDCELATSHLLSESWMFGGATIAARHRASDPLPPKNANGVANLGTQTKKVDSVAVPLLKNGWTLAGYAWWWWEETSFGFVLEPAGFAPGAKSGTVQMNWCHVSSPQSQSAGKISYRVDLWVTGPAGVPYY